MTDHRATDLSYGHPGKASYDPEEKQWTFSINLDEEQHIRQIQPFTECLPLSTQKALQEEENASVTAKSQLKWLLKSHPETFPGNEIVASLLKAPQATGFSSDFGTLMAIGQAVDTDRLSGRSRPLIAAIPCGEAGHVLRLIRLRTQKYSWEAQNGPSVALLDPDYSDQAYWMGIGGTIRQITFSEDENGSRTWLAVRQSSVTTICRPFLGQVRRAGVPTSSKNTYQSSRLSANPVAVLTMERSNSSGHRDVTFNPWYARQFAVVDSKGLWSIWDIEGNQDRYSSQKLAPGKSGDIHDSYQPKQPEPSSVDGWHRMLWVCNISTIVVCNRRHVAVFDLKATPSRLHSIDFSASGSPDWILDIKRSLANPSHLFVLSTARIFWVEIVPAGDDKKIQAGAKILLSYRHFRDANDETMRLSCLEDDTVSVLISSSKIQLVNFYGFSTHTGTTSDPTAWQGSFLQSLDPQEGMREISFLPAPLTYGSGEEPDGAEHGSRFFRVLALTSNLTFCSALYMAHVAMSRGTKLPKHWITPPTFKLKQKNKRLRSERNVKSGFIVPDGLEEDETTVGKKFKDRLSSQNQDDTHLRMDWRDTFRHVFPPTDLKKLQSRPPSPDGSSTITGLLNDIYARLKDAKTEGSLTMATLLQLSNHASISEELDRATTCLRQFLDTLNEDQDSEAQSSLVVSDLTSCPAITFPSGENSTLPDLLAIYDDLVDNWMTTLPSKVTVQTRLSKHKTIRQVATELCLSSIGVALKAKDTEPPVLDEGNDAEGVGMLDGTGRGSSPLLFSPEMTPAASYSEPALSLPSPARTPSIYSHATTTTGSELCENPAITRLRQYTVSIKSQLDPGKSKLLDNWVVGEDPAEYLWEEPKADDSEEENDRRTRREETRRRKRTQKFLNRERARAPLPVAAEPQPAFLPPFGSQPDVGHLGFSSQVADELPMTQPDRGAFGSRTQKGKKKPKRRNAGF